METQSPHDSSSQSKNNLGLETKSPKSRARRYLEWRSNQSIFANELVAPWLAVASLIAVIFVGVMVVYSVATKKEEPPSVSNPEQYVDLPPAPRDGWGKSKVIGPSQSRSKVITIGADGQIVSEQKKSK